ncbi:MAG: hypothetical protein ABIP97_06240, partial [Chthoniobacterales bacterium]
MNLLRVLSIFPILVLISASDASTPEKENTFVNYPYLDATFLDLNWKRNDSRSCKELINALLAAKPTPWDQLPPAITPGSNANARELDNWRVAFNALLSKPENLSWAGSLRVYHDTHGRRTSLPFINLFTGKVRDGNGRVEILIINGQETLSNKEDAGHIACYIFDEDGRFIKGRVY